MGLQSFEALGSHESLAAPLISQSLVSLEVDSGDYILVLRGPRGKSGCAQAFEIFMPPLHGPHPYFEKVFKSVGFAATHMSQEVALLVKS